MGNIISSTTTPHPVIINRIDQQKDGVVKPSSSKENAKEKTFDGGADNGVVKRKRRKKGNLRSSSSSMANPKDAVGQPHKKIYSSFSSPSYYSSLADPEALTIDGGADNQQKDEVLKPSSSTENAKEKTFDGGAAKNDKEKTFDGGADNQQKNAVVKPEHFADRVILFQGTPTLHCSADIPQYFFWDLSDEQRLKQRSIPEGKIMRNTGTPTLHCSADIPQYFFGDLSDEQWLKQRSIPEGKIMRNTV